MKHRSSTNAAAPGQMLPTWTHVLPDPVRSLGRPLLHKWLHFYRLSRERLAEPSVSVHLRGGCGNQIFQYATGLSLARRLGVALHLDITWYDTPEEHEANRLYSLGLFKGVDSPVIRCLPGRIIREESHTYNPAQFEKAPRKCSLVGFWQCERYFFDLRDELRERLLPREPLSQQSLATQREILHAGRRAVFITVRRTDYVGNPFHLVLPMDYYREAAAFIAARVSDPVFFVFTDEPEWCEANFVLPYRTMIAGNFDRTLDNHLGREDAELYLMRLCGNAIVANSSYSWWGAWLGADRNGGIVIAPKSWVGPASKCDTRDIVPSRWIRL